jgi:hypothetical protein
MREADMGVMFIVYGGSLETPLYMSSSIEKCLDFMRGAGISSIHWFTIKAMEVDKHEVHDPRRRDPDA